MARNVTLRELIEMVREEAGHSTNPAVGQADTDRIAAMLRRTQRRLYYDFNWPHLYAEAEEQLNEGQRYYGYEAGVDQERIFSVYTTDQNDNWVPISHGITPEMFTVYDSESDERYSPASRWLMRADNTYEVWPIPDSNNYKIKFIGMAPLPQLTNMTDRCVLDADLLALYVASELLMRQKAPDAEYKLGLADQHYRRIRASTQHSDMFLLGGTGQNNDTRLAAQQARYAFGPKMG